MSTGQRPLVYCITSCVPVLRQKLPESTLATCCDSSRWFHLSFLCWGQTWLVSSFACLCLPGSLLCCSAVSLRNKMDLFLFSFPLPSPCPSVAPAPGEPVLGSRCPFCVNCSALLCSVLFFDEEHVFTTSRSFTLMDLKLTTKIGTSIKMAPRLWTVSSFT